MFAVKLPPNASERRATVLRVTRKSNARRS